MILPRDLIYAEKIRYFHVSLTLERYRTFDEKNGTVYRAVFQIVAAARVAKTPLSTFSRPRQQCLR